MAARELNDAEEFAKKHGIRKAHGSYENLAEDPELGINFNGNFCPRHNCPLTHSCKIATQSLLSDVVYIGTIHPHHHAVTMMVLNHGKAVLCEKPLAMNYEEAKEMIDLAREKKLFLMEACNNKFSLSIYYVKNTANYLFVNVEILNKTKLA